MYKWPQGRIIRTICILATLAIAVDLGIEAYTRFNTYFTPSATPVDWHYLAIACVAGVLSLAVLIAGLVAVGFKHRSVDFLIEVEQEMTRVTWPTGRALVQSTIWIAVMVVILTAVIFAWDYVALTYVINPIITPGK
jgi:preprotein translocase SecE subunit